MGTMRPWIIKVILSFIVITIGVFVGYTISQKGTNGLLSPLGLPFVKAHKQEVIGFLPYWLLSTAKKDYSEYITTLTYFSLTLDGEGHIQKKTNQTEAEPGWHTLSSGRADSFFQTAKNNNLTLSLLLFAGEEDDIYSLIQDPQLHAQTVISEVIPIMQQYGFSDLNLDIESITSASASARQQFTAFVSEVSHQLKSQGPYTLTVEVTASDAIKQKLIDIPAIEPYVDHIVIMAYDYHYRGSYVTGPISPLGGSGTTYEYDVSTAIQEAKRYIPVQKIILGLPAYGYEWETITTSTSSAVLPGSGLTASNIRVESVISACTNCTQGYDTTSQEAYVIFPDKERPTYHQIYYPTAESTNHKIALTKENSLGGLAVWALGYEDSTVLEPLKKYRP